MLINNLSNTAEILAAWEDTIGDIGTILENTDIILSQQGISRKERGQLNKLKKTLEAVQECY